MTLSVTVPFHSLQDYSYVDAVTAVNEQDVSWFWGFCQAATNPPVIDAVRGALRDRGLPGFTMPSWAGHDAKVLARIAPVGMLFVPSIGGISHAPDEATDPTDCAHAAALLLHAARRVDAALTPHPEVEPS